MLQDEDETRDYERIDSRRGGYSGQDREISLGTTMLLGIFFAIALLCAVFFGFGYSLGSRHATPAPAAAAAEPSSNPFSGFKPSPFGQGSLKPSTSASSADTDAAAPPRVTVKTLPATRPAPEEADAAPAPKPAPIVRQAPAAVAPTPAPTVTPVAMTPGSAVVQVAAVSHQEDADLLVSTLKRRGYAVAIRQEPSDHLLHVQIGPFAIRKDADAMRQRLLNDGFNAIVK